MHNTDRQLFSVRHGDSPRGFHLFLKLSQLFPLQAGAVSGLRGPCLWPPLHSVHSWSAVKIRHSHFPCPGLPLHGHVRSLPQDSHLASGSSVVSGTGRLSFQHLRGNLLKDRREYGLLQPSCPVFSHVTLSSPENRPVSAPC